MMSGAMSLQGRDNYFQEVREGLREGLAEHAANVENATADIVGKLSADVAQHKSFMASAREEIQRLEVTHKENSMAQEKRKGEMQRIEAEEKAARAEVERLQAEVKLAPAKLEGLRATEKELLAQLSKISSKVQQDTIMKDRTNNDLTRGIVSYKKRLGMDFERVGEEQLMIKFTNIDPQHHERVFSFSLHIDANDVYDVIACEPHVEGIEELLRTLNATNDFSQFVRRMRKKFRALCTQ